MSKTLSAAIFNFAEAISQDGHRKSAMDVHQEMTVGGSHRGSLSKVLGPMDSLHHHRQCLIQLLENKSFEVCLGACILFNMFLLILETDASVHDGDEVATWVSILNLLLLGIYTMEILLKFVAYQCHFFFSGWNILDLVIVCSDLILLALDLMIGNMPKVTILRAFRLVRLARAFKALSMFPELALLLSGFVSAIRAIFWGMALILIVITIWAILAVQLIHPINKEVTESGLYERSGCERCPHAFESVWKAMMTIFQTLVAGDSWGTIALPIIERSPATFLFFLLVLVTVSLAIMNLILAVIVERAQQVKDDTRAEIAAEKHMEFKQAVGMLEQMCVSLDRDENQIITKEELQRGFELKEFAETMQIIGLGAHDVDTLFDALDEDSSGDIHYAEFVGQLFRLKNPDLHFITMELMTLKQRMARIKQIVINDLSELTGRANMGQSRGSSPQRSSKEMLVALREARTQEALPMRSSARGEQRAATLGAAPDHTDGPHTAAVDSNRTSASTPQEKALSELAASVRNLVRHSELQSKTLANIDSALTPLIASPPGSFRQRPLACMPGKSPPSEDWQLLKPLNGLRQDKEPFKPQLCSKMSVEEEKGGALMTSRTPPRATTPRSLLETVQTLLIIPPNSAGCHSPMHTPRMCTPPKG